MERLQPSFSGKKEYSESKRLLRKSMFDKQLVLFVGAGASIDSGLPLWSSAVKQISDKLNLTIKDLDFTIIPQYYYNARGNKEYTQLMREIFKYNVKLNTQPVHSLLLKFNTDTIITTNYDNLIEQAAEENGEFVQVISQDVDLPYRKEGKELIKIHGDFVHDNFVLKEDDYLHYHKNFKLIENYVKSIIGTKTVLFIGYSFNDPDIKHVFSWVKDVLNEHFQSAYMIVTGKSRNQNEVEYYRHLGINLIYSTELFDEDQIEEKNHTRQLVETLNFLLSDDENNKDSVDILYDYLKPFNSLNYTYRKYVEQALLRFNNSETKLSVSLDRDRNINIENKDSSNDESWLLNVLNSFNCKFENDKLQVVYESLRKSAISGIKINSRDEDVSSKIPFDFNNSADWKDAIKNFNYKRLLKIKEDNSKILSESKPDLYLQQAYISAFLNDYLSSYNCLSNAATSFYRNKAYAWYYIALWNKRNIAKRIIYDPLIKNSIDKDLFESIQSDFFNIDLEKTLLTIPDLGNEQNTFLRDIKDFKFASDLFYDVVSNSIKTSKQAFESYIVFSGVPAYEQLRQQVYDYYSYGLNNYFIVDGYRENNEIFNMFTRSIFSSVTTPDKIAENGLNDISTKNIRVKNLTNLDLHLILRYISKSELNKLFVEFNIDTVEIDKHCQQYLNNLIQFMEDAYNLDNSLGENIFWKYINFVSHTKIDSKLAISIVKIFSSSDNFDNWLYEKESISMFINSIFKQELFNNHDLCNEVSCLYKKIYGYLYKNVNKIYVFKDIFLNLIAFCNDGGFCFNDTKIANSLLSESFESLLPVIYKFSSVSVKEIIKNYFSNWKEPDNSSGFDVYSNLVLFGVVSSNKMIETKMLNSYDELVTNINKRNKNVQVFPYYDPLESSLINLYLSDKIINKRRFKNIINKRNHDFFKWIIDTENFDYSKFELSWLLKISSDYIKELSKNDSIRHSILTVYKTKYGTEYIDKRITDRIVLYFL